MMKLPRPLRWAGEALLVLAVFSAALPVFFTAKAKIDSDEGNWIGTTRYFQTYFVDRDFSARAWADGYWPRTQPMVFRYVIGSWLWYRGHDLEAQNPNYDFNRSAAANRRLGLAPADDVLDDARMPARLMATLAVTVLYVVVRLLAGPIGGLVAATFATGSPYLQEHFVRAKAESTLMFFLLGALLLAILSVRLRKTERPASALRWGVATGLLVGLAFGVKLTTVLVIVAVVAWGVSQDARVTGLAARLRGRLRPAGAAGTDTLPTAPDGSAPRPGSAWLWVAAVLAATGFVFIVSNPFLWPNPVGRTWLLFENRRIEMAQQQKDVPTRAVHTLDRRVALVWERSVYNDAFAPSRLGWPLESVLTVVGAAWLAVRAAFPRPGRPNAEWMVLLWLGFLWAGVSVGLGFLLQHYFVPTATIATLLSGLAVGWAVQALWNLAMRAVPHLRTVPTTPAGAH
ncbi:MAG: glycosyltransferase family 39 protein [Chloroflexi bacterium]|nr:glycosyltransferase family 39 protein [Chloroflexota bacterium]